MQKMRGNLFTPRKPNVMTTSRLGTLLDLMEVPGAARMGRKVSHWTGTVVFLLESDVGCLFPDPSLNQAQGLLTSTCINIAKVGNGPCETASQKSWNFFFISCLPILLNPVQGKIYLPAYFLSGFAESFLIGHLS